MRAEVVIVGGGVMGTSAAFHLAEAGVRDVVLVERAALGSGSTSKAAGGVRAQFSDELNVRLGLRSLEAFERFAERPGGEIGLRQVGYLFLLTTPSEVEAFTEGVALQNRLGVPSRMVSAQEARRLCPLVEVDDVLGASYCPRDGTCTPEGVVAGYAAAARALGARILTGCEVTAIDTRGDRIAAVDTSAGEITAGCVVCTAGAWSPQVGAMVGLDLPVTPSRRQVGFTGPVPGLPERIPLTIDFASGLYFHREGQGLLFGMGLPDEPAGYNLTTDQAWLEPVARVAERRAPVLLEAGYAGGWAGLYEITPDHNALLGRAASPETFVYATGFSGHGFLQGPAVGEIVRDLVLGREPAIDVSALAVERFATRALRPETNVV